VTNHPGLYIQPPLTWAQNASVAVRSRAPLVSGHNRQFTTALAQPLRIGSYHPNQQNTSAGELRERTLLAVFRHARKLL
jgi:hypothetical protein